LTCGVESKEFAATYVKKSASGEVIVVKIVEKLRREEE
jgi:hypothetical protein